MSSSTKLQKNQECCHNDCHHHGIDKQDGGGYASIHESETLVIRNTGCGKEQSERAESLQVTAVDSEGFTLYEQHCGQHQHRHGETIEEYGRCVHALLIKR